jgi:hypothetical protein
MSQKIKLQGEGLSLSLAAVFFVIQREKKALARRAK